MTVAICTGRTKDGKPCAAKPRPGTELCPWHTPELAGQRAEWSRTGGRNSSSRARARKALPGEPLSNAEIHAYMSIAFKKTLVGQMEPGVFTALANGARTLADLSKVVNLEDQLAEMRRQIVDIADRRPAS
jgi:hypothetical protein